MTEFTGSILELDKNKAIVMTEACDFVSIQRKPQMFVGQQIKFRKSDITKTNKNYQKYFALAASVFIIALCSVFFFRIFIPSTVYAYINVDINPSIEFSIDKNAKVLGLKPLNNDAKTLLTDLKLIDLPLKEAINEIVEESKQLGFISTSKENAILISASIDEGKNYELNSSEEIALNNILSDISSITFDIGNDKIKPDILKVTPENRKSAVKNDISMGRYALYSKIKEENKDITVENAKTERVSDMLKKAKIKGSDKNKADDSNSINKEAKDKNSNDSDTKDKDSKSAKDNAAKNPDTKATGVKGAGIKKTDSEDNVSKDTDVSGAGNDSEGTDVKDTVSKNTDVKSTETKDSKYNKKKSNAKKFSENQIDSDKEKDDVKSENNKKNKKD